MTVSRRHPHYGVTFAILMIGAVAYTILQSLVLPALPALRAKLHTSESTVTWLLTAYLLAAAVATPILGRLGDMFGKKLLLVIVLTTLSAGTALAAVASSIGLLIVARAIQGVAGAIFPLAFGILRDELPPRRLAGAIGMTSAVLGIGSGLGTVLAGPIIEHLDYHWLFWFPLILAGGATVAAFLFVPESPERTPGRVNLPAAFLLAGWLSALLLGVSEGPSWGWASAGTLGLFAAAAVLGVAWVQLELRSAEPLVDMRMMRIPAVWWTNISALLMGVGMYSIFVLLPPFLQTPRSTGYGFGASVTTSGLFLLPSTATMLVAGLAIGRVARRFGSKATLVAGSLLAAAAFGLLTVAHGTTGSFLVASAVLGLGIGFAFSAMSNLVMDAVPASQTGVATGMNANIRTIGGSIGSVVVASILASGLRGDGYPREGGYAASFGLMTVVLLIAAAAAVLIPVANRTRTLAGTEIAEVPVVVPPASTQPVSALPVSTRPGPVDRTSPADV